MIRFDSKTQIIVSDDLTNDVWKILEEEESSHVGLIVDSNIWDNQEISNLSRLLESRLTLYTIKIDSKEPTTDMVNDYTADLAGKDIDMIIGIGGGSIIDLSKALSVMAVNAGKVEDYHGTDKRITSGIKKIMIPTTAGTGSEVTPGAVLVNTHTKYKRAIGGKHVTPDYAVLSAKLTLSMPNGIIVSTGMDALAHAIESYTAKCANMITRMFSRQAFSLVYNNLPKVLDDKTNIELRQNVLMGSCLAGYAIFNSNTGACHSMAYPLGIYNDIPHGVAVAYILPHVIRINLDKGCNLYGDLYDMIEGVEKPDSRKEKARRFGMAIENYKPLTFMDKSIIDYGVDLSNYEFLAERGLDLTPALSNNPEEFGLKEAQSVLRKLLKV